MKYCLPILFLSFIFSCVSQKNTTEESDPTENVKSITLLATMLGPIKQPVLPIVDAGLFNAKTDNISDELNRLQGEFVTEFQSEIAAALEKGFGSTVMVGKDLYESDSYQELIATRNFYNELKTNSQFFPLILMPQNAVNVFEFDDVKPFRFFGKNKHFGEQIKRVFNFIKTDLIAISYTRLNVIRAGTFGRRGDLRLDTYLYLYNPEGKLISYAHSMSPSIRIHGKYIKEYESVLKQFDNLINKTVHRNVLSYRSKMR